MGIAYLFPGQGSHSVGMGKALFEAAPEARAIFEQADDILSVNLSSLCFDGPLENLTETVNQQPALLTCSIATWQHIATLEEWPPAAFVAGHSLGEFSALVAAGSMTFADALRLVRQRGELMQAAGEQEPGGMAASLGLDADVLRTVCAEAVALTNRPVQVANDNCPGQIVISGDRQALDKAVELAKEAGARKVVVLPITIAAHSQLMASASEAFAQAVEATPIEAPSIPVIGNASAAPLTTPAEIRDELKAQLTASVRWTESMQYLLAQGITTFSEVGPGDVLTKLMRRIDRKATRRPFVFDS